jgi:[citrate (pro-3S)-lyase] ligase
MASCKIFSILNLFFILIIIPLSFSDYEDITISRIYPNDKYSNSMILKLLNQEGIKRDRNLDYTCVAYDSDYNIIGTGSCFGNTLRCLAVSNEHQGEGITNKIVSHLIQYQFDRGNFHLFIYTKYSTYHLFKDLGFYEIVRIKDQIVFMENKKNGFNDYLNELSKSKLNYNSNAKKIAAIVMNANPFTLGHLYLIEKASKENDILHLFIVSEDKSIVPFIVRKKLIIEGTAHLKNIIYHDSGPYIISSATFPSYFQKDEKDVIESHANLDLEIFVKIAKVLNINIRYVGEEPTSLVTGIYNKIMEKKLPENGIECFVVKRKEMDGNIISASEVRKKIKEGNIEGIKNMVPDSTYKFFISEEGKNVINKIKQMDDNDIKHY